MHCAVGFEGQLRTTSSVSIPQHNAPNLRGGNLELEDRLFDSTFRSNNRSLVTQSNRHEQTHNDRTELAQFWLIAQSKIIPPPTHKFSLMKLYDLIDEDRGGRVGVFIVLDRASNLWSMDESQLDARSSSMKPYDSISLVTLDPALDHGFVNRCPQRDVHVALRYAALHHPLTSGESPDSKPNPPPTSPGPSSS